MTDKITEKCVKYDYITVAGTSEYFNLWRQTKSIAQDILEGYPLPPGTQMADPKFAREYREEQRRLMRTTYDFGNKMMFLAQGVRALREYGAVGNFRTFIYFTTGYTKLQRQEAEKAAAKYASPDRIFPISTVGELITLINDATFPGETCERKIKRIDLFCHGLPKKLEFGYKGDMKDKQRLEKKQARKLDPARFELPHKLKADIFSWACQTGNDDENNWGGLAPTLAKHTQTRVHAYARRTLYSKSFHTGGKSESEAGLVRLDDGKENIVIWHPDGALGGVTEGNTPASAPSGRRVFE
ncbi:hypothetical protein PSE_1200 [Pseudovibrio sp. FO-BEG1]|uniref:hypothetical protein n=1 Tax=Pseudovibrio sp. (strain FO-BEG1) TaxID=911045 RepID=UPI000238CFCA|nr:hypothetical protein [Pseudovibrio sp. FO-BEG1]AEV35712.1 hypothetical protein PSE_1200 [Pseudovibrio sp. FO-BEG1]